MRMGVFKQDSGANLSPINATCVESGNVGNKKKALKKKGRSNKAGNSSKGAPRKQEKIKQLFGSF